MVKVKITHCYISLGHYCTIIELFAHNFKPIKIYEVYVLTMHRFLRHFN